MSVECPPSRISLLLSSFFLLFFLPYFFLSLFSHDGRAARANKPRYNNGEVRGCRPWHERRRRLFETGRLEARVFGSASRPLHQPPFYRSFLFIIWRTCLVHSSIPPSPSPSHPLINVVRCRAINPHHLPRRVRVRFLDIPLLTKKSVIFLLALLAEISRFPPASCNLFRVSPTKPPRPISQTHIDSI